MSLHYGTIKVFKSDVRSSQADFYEHPAVISYHQLPRTPNSELPASEFDSLIATLHGPNLTANTLPLLLRHATAHALYRNRSCSDTNGSLSLLLRHTCRRTTWPLPRQSTGPLVAVQQRPKNICRNVASAYRGAFIGPLKANDHLLLARA
jgi:hypothetical protein